MSKKDFKFIVEHTETGDVFQEQIVTFGSKERPFPKDWKESNFAIMSLQDYGDEIVDKMFTVHITENLEFTIPDQDTVLDLTSELRKARRTINGSKNPIDGSELKMDLSDIGNTVGIEIQKAIERGEGSMDDFMNGLKHGISIIDGTHG